MKKKIVMICCTALVLSLVGCSSSTKTSAEVILEETAVQEEAKESDLSKDASKVQEAIDNTESQTEQQSDSSMAIGQVSAIDGDTITVVLGEMSMDGGEASTKEVPTKEAPIGEAPSGEAPTKEAPTGESPAAAPFIASEDSIAITFDGTVAIQLMVDGEITEGNIDDISVDDILSIEYDESGAVASVQIMNREPGGSKPADAGTSDKSIEAETDMETQVSGE